MKALILVLLWTSGALAAPFLISDPPDPCGQSGQPACPVSATIYADGAVIADDVPLQPDMSIRYDLMTRPVAEVTYTATYKDAMGDHSDLSDPYLLLAPPASPKGLRGTGTP